MPVESPNSSSQTLYIKNLNRRLPIKEVKRRVGQLVSQYVNVAKIKMTNRPNMLGQAFVHLAEPPKGDVIAKLNERFFLGKNISVTFAHEDMCIGKRRETKVLGISKTLILKDISDLLAKEDIEKLFRSCVGFEGVRFIRVKNLALVDFVSVEDASAAYSGFENGRVECDGTVMEIFPSA